MAKKKHWEVATAFRVHGDTAVEAQASVEKLVQRFLDAPAKAAGLTVVTVHRATRLRGPSDSCPECRTE